MNKKSYMQPEPLLCSVDGDINITMDLVNKYIARHKERLPRYERLKKLYLGFHRIYKLPDKEKGKPDNRMAVNFPRYITDTFLGYAYGVPIKKTHPDTTVNDAIAAFDLDNDIADHDHELAKMCCQYGHAFEYFYQDEESKTKVVACTPEELFVVYDDTLKRKAVFAVRYGYKEDGHEKHGEVMTRDKIYPFSGDVLGEPKNNPYGKINVVEYILNQERLGLYEEVAELVEVYNKTITEKANDVDEFAEAYLAILGAEIDEEGVYHIRDNRIINLYGTDSAKDILVQFLQKPTADGTQENLLDRLETLIYKTSMVADISDESFGNASGVSLAYKLQAMSNLALTTDRKFIKSMKKRYKLFCCMKTNISDKDAWKEIEFKTTRNIPKNILEESQTAQNLEGVVSKETQLSVLSIVDSVQNELEKIAEEDEKEREQDPVIASMFGNQRQQDDGGAEVQGKSLNGAQTQSLIAIMSQFSAGTLSEGQAVNLISTAIGIGKDEARAILDGEL